MPRESNPKAASPQRIAGRIALIYASFGLLWIVLSDAAVNALVGDTSRVGYAQTFKGWAFILATALLVYFLVCRYAMAVEQSSGRLQISEERYRKIVETANEGICIVDPSGALILANARFAELVGHPPAELLGEPLLSLVQEGSRHDLAEKLEQGASACVQPTDVKLSGRGGQEVWTLAALSPMLDDSQCRTGTLLMFTDISERKRLEAQLLQLQKMEAVGQLAGGIAHDFNNIITAILGTVDLMRLQLKRKPVPIDSLAADIDQLERAGERAMSLTRQLLTFSRRQVLRPEIIEPARLLEDMEKMLSRLIRDDIRLRVVSTREVPAIRADAGQLEQVIVNLVVNARDAMPEGGQLTIEATRVHLDERYVAMHPEAREGGHVLIAVSDTGQGMDRRTMARIFEPFFTTKPTGKGTGLGLATVYGLVKQFGGHVSVYSEPGVGTTFKVYLPAVEGVSTVDATQARAEPIPGGEETIVVCEDNEAIRNMLLRVLGEKGYDVEVFDTPPAALEAVQHAQRPVHLLITDVVMADMSGPELAERLQMIRPDLRVLYVSGYTSEVIAQHGILEPGVEFLPKPFTSEALLRRVRGVLDDAGVRS